MISSVSFINTSAKTTESDDFAGSSLSSDWSAASWIGTAPSTIDLTAQTPTTGATVGAVYKTVAIDSTAAYQIDIFIVPYLGEHWGTYQIFARMDATPDATDEGIIAEITLTGTGGAYTGKLQDYTGGSLATEWTFSGNTGQSDAGWFRVHINGDVVTVSWLGTSLTSQTVTSHTGERVGFGMDATVDDGLTLVDRFRLQFTEQGSTVRPLQNMLVASANGTLYREAAFTGVMAAISGTVTTAADRAIQSTERGQKLYIADVSDRRVSGTDGARGSANNKLDASSVSDWTAHSIDFDDDVLVITDATGDIVDGTYKLTSATSGELTTASNIATGGTGTCTFRIERGPKVFDPLADTLTIWTATSGKGQVPTGRPLIARYRDRLVLAGGVTDPINWEMSRQGDPLDFDYTAADTDAQRAVAGNNADAGEIGEPIIALIVLSDDYMIFGCRNSLWLLRGDPSYGGRIDPLSETIGVVDATAWAAGPNGEVYILSRDGLYVIPPGGGRPESLSRERLPQELLDLDGSTLDIQLRYDVRHRGLWIFLTEPVAKDRTHYFFQLETGAFWPDVYPGTMEPTASHAYAAANAWDDGVYLGCRDGKIRRHHRRYEHDDGTDIDSYVLYGPMRLSDQEFQDGKWQNLIGVVAQDSGDVTWEILAASTFEAVPEASARETGTWSPGVNNRVYPRVRGYAAALKLTGPTKERWAIERVQAVFESAGLQRP